MNEATGEKLNLLPKGHRDVVTGLQNNDPPIADFGQPDNEPRAKEKAALERISNLVAKNRIRVEAHAALTPMPGRLYGHHRPHFVPGDDLSNAIAAEPPVAAEKVVRLLNQTRGGTAGRCAFLTLSLIHI